MLDIQSGFILENELTWDDMYSVSIEKDKVAFVGVGFEINLRRVVCGHCESSLLSAALRSLEVQREKIREKFRRNSQHERPIKFVRPTAG